MMTTRSRLRFRSSGSAERPSSSGMSTSRTTTSGLQASSWSIASRPVRTQAATNMSFSSPIQRVNCLRTTMASSTTITRIGFPTMGAARAAATAVFMGIDIFATRTFNQRRLAARRSRQCRAARAAATRVRHSEQADFLKLRLDNVLVEGFHDVLFGAGMQRPGNMGDIVLGGAEHHLRLVAAGQAAQRPQELVNRPSSACSNRAGSRPESGRGTPRWPPRRSRLPKSGNRDLREYAVPPCG